MKLVTQVGELALPSDFQFEIIENNPFFSDEGSQSIPTTIPAIPDTIKKLDICRPATTKRITRKIEATLQAGAIHKTGQLVLASKSENSVVGSILLNESDLYSKMKEVKLPELLSKISKPFTSVESAYNYLFSVYKKEVSSDFAVFPVQVNKNLYTTLNEPDTNATEDIYPLKWQARNIMYNGETATVPDGFGITPFIYLGRLIDIVFKELGYQVVDNPFSNDPALNKVVILNNCADTICKSKIEYSQIVPDCTVSEFLEFLLNRYHATPFVNSEKKTVEIIFFENVLAGSPTEDISKNCQTGFVSSFLDRRALNLVENADLEDAKPAFETFEKMYEKWQQDQNDFSINYITGSVYEILSPGTNKKFLGSLCFNFLSSPSLDKETFQAVDRAILIRIVNKLPVPYIGQAIYRNTKYNNEDVKADEQKIMQCFSVGRGDGECSKYFYGSTQNYTPAGKKWGDFALNYPGLYDRFWKRYCLLLLNQSLEFSAIIRYNLTQIASFNFAGLKSFQGVPVIVKKRKINIGNSISFGDTELLSTRLYNPIQDYIFPVVEESKYYWRINNDSSDYYKDDREWESRIEYLTDVPTFKGLKPPTEDEFTAGGRYHSQSVEANLLYKRVWETEWQRDWITVWFWAEPWLK